MKKEKYKNTSKNRISSEQGSFEKKLFTQTNIFNLIGLIFILVVGVSIYSNSFNCSFNFDDLNNFGENKKLPELGDFKAWWHYSHTRLIGLYSFALNIQFNHFDVWGYHFVNLLIHLVNAVLIWWLTILIFSTPVIENYRLAKYKNEIAFITALLFVSHPLATQSVTYIVQRLASMVSMFYFLSIALYLRARLIDKSSGVKLALFVCCFLSALLAMLTKENAFTLPFAILLVEIFFLNSKKLIITLKDYRQLLIVIGIVGFILLLSVNYSFKVFKPILPNEAHAYELTSFSYLFTQFSVIVKYIQLLIIPVNQIVDYDFKISNSFFEIRTFGCFLFLVLLISLAFYLFKRNRIVSFGIFWFLLTLSIESSIIPINDVIFEHRTYLPSFGFCLILCSCIYLFFRENYKFFTFALLMILIGMNSFLTYNRNKVWKDDLTLWSDNVEKTPHKARPIHNLGVVLLKQGKWDKAQVSFSKAIEINPDYAQAYLNRGLAFMYLKENDKALKDFNKAIELKPNDAQAFFNKATLYMNNKMQDQAIAEFSKAIELMPSYTEAYVNRGNLLRDQSRIEEALKDYQRAIELKPNLPIIYFNRGSLFMNQKKYDQARVDFNKAISLKPDYNKAYYNLGVIFYNEKNYHEAIRNYSKAIDLNKDFAMAYYSRGLAENDSNKKEEACRDVKKAADLGYQTAIEQYNLICK